MNRMQETYNTEDILREWCIHSPRSTDGKSTPLLPCEAVVTKENLNLEKNLDISLDDGARLSNRTLSVPHRKPELKNPDLSLEPRPRPTYLEVKHNVSVVKQGKADEATRNPQQNQRERLASDSEDCKEPTRLGYLNWSPTWINNPYERYLADVGRTDFNVAQKEEKEIKKYNPEKFTLGIQPYKQQESIDNSSEEEYENLRIENRRRDLMPSPSYNHTESEGLQDGWQNQSGSGSEYTEEPTIKDLWDNLWENVIDKVEHRQMDEIMELMKQIFPRETTEDWRKFVDIELNIAKIFESSKEWRDEVYSSMTQLSAKADELDAQFQEDDDTIDQLRQDLEHCVGVVKQKDDHISQLKLRLDRIDDSHPKIAQIERKF